MLWLGSFPKSRIRTEKWRPSPFIYFSSKIQLIRFAIREAKIINDKLPRAFLADKLLKKDQRRQEFLVDIFLALVL